MEKFVKHTGKAVPMFLQNVDTDQIMPKQFLKRIERSGYGEFVFWDWRFNPDGTPKTDFVLNDAKYNGGSILIAGANFGCGSSREHAPWGLTDYGFKAVIAPSFADIFFNNSMKNGLLPIKLSENDCETLAKRAKDNENYRITIDLENTTISDSEGFSSSFEIDPFRQHCMLNGLDDIGLTLQHAEDIGKFEASRAAWQTFQTA